MDLQSDKAFVCMMMHTKAQMPRHNQQQQQQQGKYCADFVAAEASLSLYLSSRIVTQASLYRLTGRRGIMQLMRLLAAH